MAPKRVLSKAAKAAPKQPAPKRQRAGGKSAPAPKQDAVEPEVPARVEAPQRRIPLGRAVSFSLMSPRWILSKPKPEAPKPEDPKPEPPAPRRSARKGAKTPEQPRAPFWATGEFWNFLSVLLRFATALLPYLFAALMAWVFYHGMMSLTAGVSALLSLFSGQVPARLTRILASNAHDSLSGIDGVVVSKQMLNKMALKPRP